MEDIKYVVIMDGSGIDEYGVNLYLTGIFNTEKEAEDAITECIRYFKDVYKDYADLIHKDRFKTYKTEIGWYHYPHLNEDDSGRYIYNDQWLGGYVE